MLRVLSDSLIATDGRRVTLFGFLDMSAAFDCVDHDLLLQRLEKNFGLTGVVLRWMTSFLSDRTLEVRIDTMARRRLLSPCTTEFHRVRSSGRYCSTSTRRTSLSS